MWIIKVFQNLQTCPWSKNYWAPQSVHENMVCPLPQFAILPVQGCHDHVVRHSRHSQNFSLLNWSLNTHKVWTLSAWLDHSATAATAVILCWWWCSEPESESCWSHTLISFSQTGLSCWSQWFTPFLQHLATDQKKECLNKHQFDKNHLIPKKWSLRKHWWCVLWPMSYLITLRGGVHGLHCSLPVGGDQDDMTSGEASIFTYCIFDVQYTSLKLLPA